MIDAGADVNAAGEDGYTPIHAALAQSNVPLARRLTACGASWNAVNKFACSVRDAARRSDDPAVRALLEQEEVVSSLPGRIGHFRLESGHHSDLWTDLELLCLRPEFVRQRAAELAARLGQYRVDAVCGPLVEGAFVALMVASDLDVEFYYTERFTPQADESLLFPVEYRVPPVLRGRLQGKRVAIVNDVISAGSAVRGTLADLEACGAETVAVAALAVLGPSAARVRRPQQPGARDSCLVSLLDVDARRVPVMSCRRGPSEHARRERGDAPMRRLHEAGVPLVLRAGDCGVAPRRDRLPLPRSGFVALRAGSPESLRSSRHHAGLRRSGEGRGTRRGSFASTPWAFCSPRCS